MARINFDPELMRNIKIIYGNADLDGRTLKQLYQTWKSNPDIIRNTARLKMPELKQASLNVQSSALPSSLKMRTQEIANDDLRGIKNFNTAFGEARKRGLNLFIWGNGKYTTKLATVKPTNTKVAGNPNTEKKSVTRQPVVEIGSPIMHNPFVSGSTENAIIVSQNQIDDNGNLIGTINTQYPKTSDKKLNENSVIEQKLWGRTLPWGAIEYRQQGGQVNNQQQEMQKKFIQFLIQDAAKQGIQIKSELDLQKYAQSLGEEGLKAKLQEFLQAMQGGVMARFGAKLDYLKKLKGVCPEGYELKFFKQGGRFCKVCEKGEKLKQKTPVNKNDTIHVNNQPYDLTGKHKQYPKLTPEKYRKLSPSKQTDVDLKDQARKDKCGAKLKKKKK